MGRKKKETAVSENIELDEFINDGKNLNMDEINKVIEENKQKEMAELAMKTAKEEQERKLAEEEMAMKAEEEKSKSAQEDFSPNGKDVEDTQTEDELPTKPNEIEEAATECSDDECPSIDDVIEECTGKVEEEPIAEKKTEKKKKEPWYVLKAKRTGDYYNW